jgi:hypothetical protein
MAVDGSDQGLVRHSAKLIRFKRGNTSQGKDKKIRYDAWKSFYRFIAGLGKHRGRTGAGS